MKTKYNAVFLQIFFFLSFTNVYSQWERLTNIGEIQSYDQIQNDNSALLLSSTSLDSFISVTMSTYHIPGLSACILKEGDLVWNKAYGYADFASKIPMTDSTLFWIASISKTITGTALMQLFERGLFNLDDNVNDYLPPDLQVVNPSYPNIPITFKMILSHVSSINDNYTICEPLFVAGDSPISLYDFLKGYLVPGSVYYTNTSYGAYPPASTYNYCNVGAALLGYLVEAITDTAFDEYCRKHIFEPLSMNETSWFLTDLDTSHIARPHEWTSSGYEPLPHWGQPYYPCSQLRTSSLQLARFLNMFMQKGTLENTKILDSSTVALMTTIHYPQIPVGGGYPDSSQGLIWYQETFGNRLVWGHSGGPYGVTTAMYYYMPEKSGVIVLVNSSSNQAPYTWNGVKKIISALFDYAVTIPTGIIASDEIFLGGFTLRQNYPNPFNLSTTIEYDLPKAGHVRLVIYDLLGRQIRMLIDTKQPAGNFQTSWNGTNEFSLPVATGVYLCRMETGEFVKVTKLLLVK
jgi:CubicO group peptidase (beta-lactamase class C family)